MGTAQSSELEVNAFLQECHKTNQAERVIQDTHSDHDSAFNEMVRLHTCSNLVV